MPTVTDRQRTADPSEGDTDTAEEPRASGDKIGEGAGTITERLRRESGEEERPVEVQFTPPTSEAAGIDADRVADMTVEEAEQFVEANPTLRDTVVELERAGKNRKGIMALAPDDEDTTGDGDGDAAAAENTDEDEGGDGGE